MSTTHSTTGQICDAVAVRLTDGGKFLIWAAGRERPDEELVELFSVDHVSVTYDEAVASGDKAPIVMDEQGEARGRCALTLFD